jgi:iron complex outermembrane receptor protein
MESTGRFRFRFDRPTTDEGHMKVKHTPIASAVALALMSAAYPTFAQQTDTQPPAQPAASDKAEDAKKKAAEEPQTVVVTGIRASLQQSLSRKRNADSVVEVITAEDIGKMPDKNVADSLQRVPGVTISSASASEGGFDENDRVSLRGTNPSLTQTTINGHMIGSGDWFVLNQVGTVGRSVSYSLLPSELVGQVVVRKSATADQLEGGVAGTVDILTRRPLDFKKKLTLEASAGAVYADLPGKTDPQFSGMLNFKNDANTMGVLVQAFSEKRHLRRDGQETLGYGTISPTSPLVTGVVDPVTNPNHLTAHPDLAGVMYPNAIGSALFEQVRERNGGLLDVQIKPTNDLMLDFSGFKSHMKATNFNRNFLVWTSHVLNGGNAIQDPDPGYVVQNNTLTSASFTPQVGKQYAIDDQIYRPGANSDTTFFNFDGTYRLNDRLAVSTKIGTSKGKGETPKQDVFEGDILNTGATYALHGIGSPADASLPNGNPAVFTGTTLDWIFGASPARTNDKENWAQLDSEYAIDKGAVTTLKFGARVAEHKRDTVWIAQGPNSYAAAAANLPAWNGTVYPGDFGSGLGGGNFPRSVWQLDPGILEAWGDKYSNRDPVTREYFPGEFAMKESNSALYAMANLEGQGWSGNVGVRLVRTKEQVTVNVAIPGTVCAVQAPCSVPGAITTSAFGSFFRQQVDNTYNDVLPSANLKFDLSKDLVGRLALAKTIARPDFSALGGAVSLDDLNHTGSGGNPNLKPIRSTNFDASLEWYFAPKSLLSAGLFYMDLSNYVSFGVAQATYYNVQTQAFETYNVSSPINSKGKVKGLELSYQQPIAGNFGVVANYTYADAHEQGGGPLVGASKDTYNLTGYFENDRFNARLAYTYRSKFYNGLDRSTAQYQYNTATLAASIGYRISDNLSITLDALNLNNPVLKYYANNPDQPTAFYNNGRQYYLMLRAKL